MNYSRLKDDIDQFQLVDIGNDKYMFFLLINGDVYKTPSLDRDSLDGIINDDFDLVIDKVIFQDNY